MNKFDKELNKILLEQNLLNENAFLDGLKTVGNKIKGALNWGIDKIKSFVEKIWNFFTPDNAEQSANKIKSVVQKIPGDTGKQLSKAINIGNSPQYQSYLKKRLLETYQTKQNFQQLSIQQQKDFTKKCADEYIKNNNIISEEIINEGVIAFTICVIIITICSWLFKNTWFKSDQQKATDAAKEKAKQDQIKRQNDIKNIEHQQYLDDQQRKQLFKLVAQSSYFN